MNKPSDKIRVVIPLIVRRRNGRSKILPSENAYEQEARVQTLHILKALGRAWAWRRKLASGKAATVGDISRTKKVTDRFVSRTMRLAYLAPEVLERLALRREPPAISVLELIEATYLPWARQMERVFGD
jgi:hypothetical protein